MKEPEMLMDVIREEISHLNISSGLEQFKVLIIHFMMEKVSPSPETVKKTWLREIEKNKSLLGCCRGHSCVKKS